MAGLRTVPVEIGKNYLDQSWGQKLMNFGDFIDNYVIKPKENEGKGYLAQTPLFDQIPDLKKDICIPEYCSLEDPDYNTEDDEERIVINAWFGPKGTISPTHFDPKNNLLCQVVGRKYIRLYDPVFSSNLYPHSGRIHFNTSQVDIENVNPKLFPKFSSTPYQECILGPGEMLFIPKKWWHFVKSLSISFSVSFWWV